MDCESFTCIGDYTESEGQLAGDVAYQVGLVTDKLDRFRYLAEFLKKELYQTSQREIHHADVGCSVGTLVQAFASTSFKSIGYDTNLLAIDKARSLFPEREFSTAYAGSDGRQFDLVTMIDVLEHIKTPFEFFASILPALKPGGHMFILVPRVDRDSWHFLAETVNDQLNFHAASPFRDNDVHVVHYSSKGLARIGEIFGLALVADYRTAEWPLNGMLFRKG